MFRDIRVFSRTDMIQYTYELTEPCVIVSISDACAEPPCFADNRNIVDVLYLFFDDEEDGNTAMTTEDAVQIVDFMEQYRDENIAMYFHCNAGVSRSAACAAAAMLIEWGDDTEIFDNGRYAPNMHCYRSILDASEITYDDIELARKHKHQFDLWVAEHADMLY